MTDRVEDGWSVPKPMGKPKRQPHSNSLKNLRPPWKPGECPPGAGRPKKLPITDRYREQCEEALPDAICSAAGLKRGSKWGDLLARRMVRDAALKGNVPAARELADRLEGKPQSQTEISTPDGQVVVVLAVPRPNYAKG